LAAALRLFVALWPAQTARSAVVTAQQALNWPAAARVIPASDLHITIAFIGAVPDEQLNDVAHAANVPNARIELTLDQLEVWKGGIVVLRPSAVPAAAVDLHGRLTESLRACGVHFDVRPFAPHVTLGRKAKGIVLAALPPVPWRSAGHVLARSVGGRYSVVTQIHCQGTSRTLRAS
jgi:2'-5' RNA ligase